MAQTIVNFEKLNPTETDQRDIARIANDFFQSWSTEGGLTDALNSALRAAHSLEAVVTGSSPTSLTLSVYRVFNKPLIKK